MKTEKIVMFGQDVDLVIKVRRLIAQLRAVRLVQRVQAPVIPGYPAYLHVSSLECYGLAQDPDALQSLAEELNSLLKDHGDQLEIYEQEFAKRVYAELLELHALLSESVRFA